MPPQAKDAPSIKVMENDTSGFTDPWCLVELQNNARPQPPSMEAGAPPPPVFDPHSGTFYLWPNSSVNAEPIEKMNLPVSRDAEGKFSVDLTGIKLANPPRLESIATINNGEFLGPINLVGYDPATSIAGAEEKPKTDEPKAETTSGAPDATKVTPAAKSVPVSKPSAQPATSQA